MGDPTPPEDQSNEQLPWGRIVLIAAASLAVFALGGVLATWLAYGVTGRVRDDRVIAEKKVASDQIGMVETRIISTEQRAQQLARDRKQRLETYGWIDRDQHLIHIPIERGMQLVAEGKR